MAEAIQERGRFSLVDPQGKQTLVSPDDAAFLIKEGYRPETEPEYQARKKDESYDAPLTAAALGIPRGLTFGASDWIATRALGVEKETLRKYIERNPLSSAAGEFGGATLGALVPGGLVARAVGSATRTAILARAAAEGAAIGAGQASSELALTSREVSKEEALGTVARATGLGTALGAGFGALGLGVGAAGKWVRGKATAKGAAAVADVEKKINRATSDLADIENQIGTWNRVGEAPSRVARQAEAAYVAQAQARFSSENMAARAAAERYAEAQNQAAFKAEMARQAAKGPPGALGAPGAPRGLADIALAETQIAVPGVQPRPVPRVATPTPEQEALREAVTPVIGRRVAGPVTEPLTPPAGPATERLFAPSGTEILPGIPSARATLPGAGAGRPPAEVPIPAAVEAPLVEVPSPAVIEAPLAEGFIPPPRIEPVLPREVKYEKRLFEQVLFDDIVREAGKRSAAQAGFDSIPQQIKYLKSERVKALSSLEGLVKTKAQLLSDLGKSNRNFLDELVKKSLYWKMGLKLGAVGLATGGPAGAFLGAMAAKPFARMLKNSWLEKAVTSTASFGVRGAISGARAAAKLAKPAVQRAMSEEQFEEIRKDLEATDRELMLSMLRDSMEKTIPQPLMDQIIKQNGDVFDYLKETMPRPPPGSGIGWRPDSVQRQRFAERATTAIYPGTFYDSLYRFSLSPAQIQTMKRIYPDEFNEVRSRFTLDDEELAKLSPSAQRTFSLLIEAPERFEKSTTRLQQNFEAPARGPGRPPGSKTEQRSRLATTPLDRMTQGMGR